MTGLRPERFVLVSGCSGGGKSTLLEELARRGYATVPEPGRRVVREELAQAGRALPWVDPEAFARRALAMALEDREAMRDHPGPVFFDRGLIDAVAALPPSSDHPHLMAPAHRYHPTIFVAPPWEEIFAADPERRHAFADATEEYRRLNTWFDRLGYRTAQLPREPVARRADFVLERLVADPTREAP